MATKKSHSAEWKAKYSHAPCSSKTALRAIRYADVDSKALVEVLDKVCFLGGAMLCAKTRDGGAFALTLFVDDDRFKAYYSDVGELLDGLKEWSEWLSGLAEAG